MLAASIRGRGQVEVEEGPDPTLLPGQALIRPEIVTICGSDLRKVYYLEDQAYPLPLGESGHEIIGRVEAVNAADGFQVGDRVLALLPMGEIGMAELSATAATHLLKVPEARPAAELVLTQQLGTVVFASRRLPNMLGKTVVVVGLGSAGQFFCALLRRMGATQVIGLDPAGPRVQAALRLGATAAFIGDGGGAVAQVAELTGGGLAEVVIEAAGTEQAINLAPNLLAVGGDLLYFGIPKHPRFEMNFFDLFRRYATVRSVSGAGRDPGLRCFHAALELILSGAIDVAGMVSHTLPLAQVAEAYRLAHRPDEGALKVGVTFVVK